MLSLARITHGLEREPLLLTVILSSKLHVEDMQVKKTTFAELDKIC